MQTSEAPSRSTSSTHSAPFLLERVNGGSFAVTEGHVGSRIAPNRVLIDWFVGQEERVGLATPEPFNRFAATHLPAARDRDRRHLIVPPSPTYSPTAGGVTHWIQTDR